MPRDDHAACCLNFGDDYPQLLVTGGQDRNLKVVDDTWILDVCARTWRKVNFYFRSIISIIGLNQYPLNKSTVNVYVYT